MKAIQAIQTIILTLASLPALSLAKTGGVDGGGGEIHRFSRKLIRIADHGSHSEIIEKDSKLIAYIQHDLKNDLKRKIRKLNQKILVAAIARLPIELQPAAELLRSNQKVLFEDIDRSTYQTTYDDLQRDSQELMPGEKEFIDFDQRDAHTDHKLGASVTFSLYALRVYDLSWSEFKEHLIAMTFHEHVRHFGFRDDDDLLAALMIQKAPGPCDFNLWEVARSLRDFRPVTGSPFKMSKIEPFAPHAWMSEDDYKEMMRCPTELRHMTGTFVPSSNTGLVPETNSKICPILKVEQDGPRSLNVRGFYRFRTVNTWTFTFRVKGRPYKDYMNIKTTLNEKEPWGTISKPYLEINEGAGAESGYYSHFPSSRSFFVTQDGRAQTYKYGYDFKEAKICNYVRE